MSQGMPTKRPPTLSANTLVTPVAPSSSLIRSRPPYHTNTSHADLSATHCSHFIVPVTSSTPSPSRATKVTSSPCQAEVIHSTPTPTKTPRVIHSVRERRPMAVSSRAANAAASGVRLISGVSARYTTHGTTAHETSPGTIAATSHPLHVTSTPTSLRARFAPRTLLAWPVKNIAHATAELWYIAAIRKAPSRFAVGPGREPMS